MGIDIYGFLFFSFQFWGFGHHNQLNWRIQFFSKILVEKRSKIKTKEEEEETGFRRSSWHLNCFSLYCGGGGTGRYSWFFKYPLIFARQPKRNRYSAYFLVYCWSIAFSSSKNLSCFAFSKSIRGGTTKKIIISGSGKNAFKVIGSCCAILLFRAHGF